MTRPTLLHIRNFGPIGEARIGFGDLTVLVGPQGAGKSLAVQWLKAALDGKKIIRELKAAGEDAGDRAKVIDLVFGVAMGAAWTSKTRVTLDGKEVTPSTIARRGSDVEKVFFIPAHRSMLISDGWAAPFQKISAETPVVARLFSQYLFDLFSPTGPGEDLFPRDRVLRKPYRDIIDRAVFHGGRVTLEQDSLHAKRLKLSHGDTQLPFMTWTAGQRELTPLLLGLNPLIPARKLQKHPDIDWVVIEEPEMGLHPQAISAVMLLCLDLLGRGYRVVLSSHSPVVLTIAWMLRRLQETHARWSLLLEAFGVEEAARRELKEVAMAALTKDVRTYSLSFGADGLVRSKDISTLDPGDEDDDVAGWGGLSGYGSRFGDAVRHAVIEAGGKQLLAEDLPPAVSTPAPAKNGAKKSTKKAAK